MLRIALSSDETQGHYYVQGFLAIVVTPDRKKAFADHLKYEGGGQQGEYHVIVDEYGELEVGDWFVCDALEEDSEYHFSITTLTGMRNRTLSYGSNINWKDGKEREGYWIDRDLLNDIESNSKATVIRENNTILISLDRNVNDYVDIESISQSVPGKMCFHD